MRNFLKLLFTFCVPACCFVLAIAIIDPFSYFQKASAPGVSDLKEKVALKVNPRLAKWIKFKKHPSEIIILGDSRSDQLKASYFEENLKEPVVNLSYGGGTLSEMIETFKEIVKIKRIKKVYIGISFNLYNARNSMNLVPEAIETSGSIPAYLSSKFCIRASMEYLKAITSNQSEIESPPFTKDEFWDYQLYSAAANFYRAYSYPQEYFNGLKSVSDYCFENNIKLIFVIPPTHIQLQKRIHDFQLTDQEKKFKSDLKQLGDVFDYDYPSELTNSKLNFVDPFHSIDSISRIVVNEITTGKIKYGRHYAKLEY